MFGEEHASLQFRKTRGQGRGLSCGSAAYGSMLTMSSVDFSVRTPHGTRVTI
jgi:hypothetical protein